METWGQASQSLILLGLVLGIALVGLNAGVRGEGESQTGLQISLFGNKIPTND